MNFLERLLFILNKPKVVIVAGKTGQTARAAILQVLKSHFQVGKEVLIYEADLIKDEINFFVKNSSLPILVATNVGEIPFDKDSFAGEKDKGDEIKKIVKILPPQGFLVLNFDDETVREIKNGNQARFLTFGFQEKADLRASDIVLNGGVNFKINYKGNIVPIWLDGAFSKEKIYSALAAASCGEILGLNLVEISQAFKSSH